MVSAFWLPLALLVIAIFSVAGGIWGADSREGFVEERVQRKARWFYHSKID
jgi:hypothetical protein